jgi:hypothetical protein
MSSFIMMGVTFTSTVMLLLPKNVRVLVRFEQIASKPVRELKRICDRVQQGDGLNKLD